MKTKMIAATLLAIPMLLFYSCKKDSGGSGGTGYMDMRMMDAPSPYAYEAVMVDVRSVEVNIASTDASDLGTWVTLQTSGGIYDLLHYTNGLDTLIASATVPEGRVSQVRLIVGTNNSVKYQGQMYPMDVPSGQQTGIKLNVQQRVSSGQPLHLFLDFDAGQSVIPHGNGTFSLRPVIRAFVASETGTVVGSISTTGPAWAVTLSGREALHSTYADPISGHFMVRGLAAGDYTIKVYPPDTDIPITLGTVTVTAGGTTDVGLLVVGH